MTDGPFIRLPALSKGRRYFCQMRQDVEGNKKEININFPPPPTQTYVACHKTHPFWLSSVP